jgi:AcrR family transcriptional regulator
VLSVASEVDGRRLRRTQNRSAVVHALVELFEEGVYQPSTGEIAERAGISPRSLFRYFDDVDDLHRAAIDSQLERAQPLLELDVSPDEPTRKKIDRFVEARVHLFETIEPAARAGRAVAHRRTIVAATLDDSRSFLRSQLRRLFAAELAGPRAALLPAIDALCSFESYELLRVHQGLSRPKTVAALTAALTQLLDPGGSS